MVRRTRSEFKHYYLKFNLLSKKLQLFKIIITLLFFCIGPIGHCKITPETKPTPSSPQSRSAQLNACSHSICLNGGTCKGNASNYTCICPSGFKGSILYNIFLDL